MPPDNVSPPGQGQVKSPAIASGAAFRREEELAFLITEYWAAHGAKVRRARRNSMIAGAMSSVSMRSSGS
jgi:hypothetical protein